MPWCSISDLITAFTARAVSEALTDDPSALDLTATDSELGQAIASNSDLSARADAAIAEAQSQLEGALVRFTLPDTPTDWLKSQTVRLAWAVLRRRRGVNADDPEAKALKDMLQALHNGEQRPPSDLRYAPRSLPFLVVHSEPSGPEY